MGDMVDACAGDVVVMVVVVTVRPGRSLGGSTP